MIDRLLTAAVASAEAFADDPAATLYPAEQAIVARAVEKRRREFATARSCARDALRRLGVPPVPILPDEQGVPRWPPGVVGSITHCAGYRAAAVARTADMLTIGIDAEPNRPTPEGVLTMVSLPAERVRLLDLTAAAPGIHWDRLLFSAKESVFKAWFPLTRRWVGFDDVDITFSAAEGTFAVRPLIPVNRIPGCRPGLASGRWLAGDGLLLTTITLPAG